MEPYPAPSLAARPEYRSRDLSLPTAIATARGVPTRTTSFCARVTAVYSRFRWSIM
jgi:hypothetical protein